MPRTDINIETGFDDNGDYCLFATTAKHEYRMPVTLDNVGEVMAMLNNAIVDLQCEERRMMAMNNETDI